ncbi:glycosyltransferase [Clostridium beijerinckii]|uniref:glycosyltransferase n=1 Tax=Clostridium beijerinckii TaxID=1520 RepID=UPI00098CAD00|nr:glycosyltransferase [Clostridium beijerinckii]NRT75731.1 glycosyltransferase involved in cell wall biosynthesis [Clostridium beijerinckii]OOM41827.1 putative teichuronic acid biosynthesis glycosyltransferase TuaG [Clostridium beijerinckii]
MDNSNLVSVLVLSYNNLKYINDCLNSILEQNYPYIEIIISDDFSNNFQKNEIQQYIEANRKENLVNYVINQNSSNLGIVKNLNNAINLATGNYFINLACDDVLFDSKVISSIVDFYSKTNFLVAAGHVAQYDEQLRGCLLTTPTWEYIKYTYGNPIDCYRKLCGGNFIPSPGMSYKRELINRYGLYDEAYRLIEDYSRWLFLTRNGCSIGYIDRFIVKYRKGGISNNRNPMIDKMFNDDLELIRKKEILPYINSIEDVIYK